MNIIIKNVIINSLIVTLLAGFFGHLISYLLFRLDFQEILLGVIISTPICFIVNFICWYYDFKSMTLSELYDIFNDEE